MVLHQEEGYTLKFPEPFMEKLKKGHCDHCWTLTSGKLLFGTSVLPSVHAWLTLIKIWPKHERKINCLFHINIFTLKENPW